MTTEAPDTRVFARVENGQVVEYPVFALHIVNRAQPFDWYKEVRFDEKPEVPDFYYLKEVVKVNKDSQNVDQVYVSYEVVPYSLEKILSELRQPGDFPGQFRADALPIAQIPQATINRVFELSRQRAQEKMDAFAQTRHYDGIASAVSYMSSSVASFQAEGSYANTVRDQTWQNLITYFGQVTSGAVPVPTTVAEIDAHLPTYTWP